MTEALRVLLVDDHALFRAGLVVLIQKISSVGEVIEVGSGEEAITHLDQDPDLDLVILDYNLPASNGLEVLRQMKLQAPELPVILLSANIDSALIQAALREHASGFITKTSTPDVMTSAVQLVLSGGVYIPPEAIAQNLQQTSFSPPISEPTANIRPTANINLTQRQREVLELMKGGLSNKEIAKELCMSPSTVKVHVAAILKELQASTRTQAVFIAKDSGLIG